MRLGLSLIRRFLIRSENISVLGSVPLSFEQAQAEYTLSSDLEQEWVEDPEQVECSLGMH